MSIDVIDLKDIRTGLLEEQHLEAALPLATGYQLEDPQEWLGYYNRFSPLFQGLFYREKLIGIAYGWPMTEIREAPADEMLLQGICVISDYWRHGLGSKLLLAFEEAVKKDGQWKIVLGSAGGFVDHFYMKNGYTPESLMLTWSWKERPSEDTLAKYDWLFAFPKEGDALRMFIEVSGFDENRQRQLQGDFPKAEVIFIFGKKMY